MTLYRKHVKTILGPHQNQEKQIDLLLKNLIKSLKILDSDQQCFVSVKLT